RAAQARRERYCRGDYRLLPRPACAFQGAEDRGVRFAANDRDRQDPKIRVARAGAVPIAECRFSDRIAGWGTAWMPGFLLFPVPEQNGKEGDPWFQDRRIVASCALA